MRVQKELKYSKVTVWLTAAKQRPLISYPDLTQFYLTVGDLGTRLKGLSTDWIRLHLRLQVDLWKDFLIFQHSENPEKNEFALISKDLGSGLI